MEIDPVKQAENLAQIFFNLSDSVDDFRINNFETLSSGQRELLKIQAQALETRAQQCTADALGAILTNIRPHLDNIQKATQDANDALKHLNNVTKGIAIANSVLALTGSIMAGDIASVVPGLQSLLKTIQS